MFKRDVTPYEISKFLQEVHNITVAPQRVYRDRSTGKLPAYKDKANNNKWFVKIADAENYVNHILTGSSKREKAW